MALAEPKPGLVISYAYLWRNQARRGEDHGRKMRPCVIILAVRPVSGGIRVVVAPVSHAPPPAPDHPSIELPQATKRRLGLDEQRSWIVLDDLNQFQWPGPDLRPIGSGRAGVAYGFIPGSLLAAVRDRIAGLARTGRVSLTPRGE